MSHNCKFQNDKIELEITAAGIIQLITGLPLDQVMVLCPIANLNSDSHKQILKVKDAVVTKRTWHYHSQYSGAHSFKTSCLIKDIDLAIIINNIVESNGNCRILHIAVTTREKFYLPDPDPTWIEIIN